MKNYFMIALLLCGMSLTAQISFEVYQDGKCIYRNEKSGKISDYTFEECSDFIGTEALAKYEGKYCIIDTTFLIRKEFSYNFMKHIKANEYVFRGDSMAGKMNSNGEIISSTKFKVANKCGIMTNLTVLQKDSLVGIFSESDGILLPVEYVSNDFAYAFMWDNELYFDERAVFCLKHKGKWGVVNVYGKTVVPFEYENAHHGYYDELIGVYKNKKWGLMTRAGKLVLAVEYDTYEYKDKVLHLVKDGKKGTYVGGNVKWETK